MQIKELSLGDFTEVSHIPDGLLVKQRLQESNLQILLNKINEIIRFVNGKEDK